MGFRCESCGEPITYAGRGRPPTRFCSRKCKDRQAAKAKRALALAERGERTCLHCRAGIPGGVTLRAKFCSRACAVTWKNRQRAEAKRIAKHAAWLAAGRICERQECGQPVPESRPLYAKFCSPACKKNDADARWRARSPHYNRQYLYGITSAEYEAVLAAQGDVCAICRTDEWPGKGNRPHTDHDRETGRFRGVLCGKCNVGIGQFDHDPARLRAAADYLEAVSPG